MLFPKLRELVRRADGMAVGSARLQLPAFLRTPPPEPPPVVQPRVRLELPDDSQRCTVIGKTGSGKTQGAVWQLSHRSFDTKPWIIFDLKYDELLRDIPGKREIGLHERLPRARQPGLYIVHPTPADADIMEDFMWKIWAQERIGVFIDEGYMIGQRSTAFQALLTQGRSKRIPVIMLTQRPSWVTRFAFSEADVIQLYQLTDSRDLDTVKRVMPMPIERDLPEQYYSWWYNSSRNHKLQLRPVPDRNSILNTFYDRVRVHRRVI